MNFVKGMDLSTLAELEKCGAKYYDNGEEKDLLEIMKSYDVDTIRIRVWNDPWSETGESYGAGENDPKTSLEIAKRVTKAGFGVLLNLHYKVEVPSLVKLPSISPSGAKINFAIMPTLE